MNEDSEGKRTCSTAAAGRQEATKSGSYGGSVTYNQYGEKHCTPGNDLCARLGLETVFEKYLAHRF
jgi:hypothetical protein